MSVLTTGYKGHVWYNDTVLYLVPTMITTWDARMNSVSGHWPLYRSCVYKCQMHRKMKIFSLVTGYCRRVSITGFMRTEDDDVINISSPKMRLQLSPVKRCLFSWKRNPITFVKSIKERERKITAFKKWNVVLMAIHLNLWNE